MSIGQSLTVGCRTTDQCINEMQKIERNLEKPIVSNWFIGGDCKIYEGHGWNSKCKYKLSFA